MPFQAGYQAALPSVHLAFVFSCLPCAAHDGRSACEFESPCNTVPNARSTNACRSTLNANQNSGKSLSAAAATDAANALAAGVGAAKGASKESSGSSRRRLMADADDSDLSAADAYIELVNGAYSLLTTQSSSVVQDGGATVAGSKAFCVGPALQVRPVHCPGAADTHGVPRDIL